MKSHLFDFCLTFTLVWTQDLSMASLLRRKSLMLQVLENNHRRTQSLSCLIVFCMSATRKWGCGTLALSSCNTTSSHTTLAFLDMSVCSQRWGIKRQSTRGSCAPGQKLVMWLSVTDTKPLLKKSRTNGELKKTPQGDEKWCLKA